jgi:predicted naringenin-chalcone synthase
MATSARLVSVGTAVPPTSYTQQELLDRYNITDRKINALFKSSHIQQRNLILPPPNEDGTAPEETNVDLLAKHKRAAVEYGRQAICEALTRVSLHPTDVDCLVCVTSTGFLCPGLSALYIRDLGFRPNVSRVDVLGMGCNAGLNSLQPVVNYCTANPGKVGLMVCTEICSAVYVFDDSVRTAVVNSLFGDGIAAVVVKADPELTSADGPEVLGFESEIIIDAIDAMRFDLEGSKFSFFLDVGIPYTIGENVEKPVDRLLSRFGLHRTDISQWVVHSGGRKVINAIKYNLGLTNHDVRHTQSVLRDHGNLSSGSFLFSYRRLLEEGAACPGDLGVMITMGPGSTIETCLVRF